MNSRRAQTAEALLLHNALAGGKILDYLASHYF